MTQFATTRWSLIEHARDEPDRSRPALEQLCRDYRPPVLAYVRRCGCALSDAEDITQEFFVRFIERGWYVTVDPGRGRFRTLLLTSLKHFIHDRCDHDHALKRGGGLRAVPLDDAYAVSTLAGPEQAFVQAWIGTVLGRALARLRQESLEHGHAEQYDRLAEYLDGRAGGDDFGNLAVALGMRRNTLSVQLHRLRERLRQLVRMELLQTVGNAEALDAELAELRDMLHESLQD